MAEGVQGGGVLGDEVAHDDAHGTVAEEFAGGIVVSRGDRQFVACGEGEAAGLVESEYRDFEEMALGIGFCRERGDRIFRAGIFQS